ncbi:ParB N-terminal domain-containing protein [Microvirga rosea]|uniref:hypothetical protein n=1 Tax=Microvirga rosea TaxID=2715425 RepID=UPI001D0ADCC8|nr:hypothetical protein [Microvirga rosea]MCB8821918.1 hypothetical protein [Microvirga rosea]
MTEATVIDMKPRPRTYIEKIGSKEWELPEADLSVTDDVALWSDNPRLQTALMAGVHSEETLEAELQRTNGYDALRRSIEDLGQMEPIYVWRADDTAKYVVLEGATRVCILRELNRKHMQGKKAGKFSRVKAKILPPHFTEVERAILLARIHVRGSGVRAWGRYIEAKFIYETVEDREGRRALMSPTEMAGYMEKSVSWVTRLRDAYKFALKFVEHVDTDDAERLAAENFSTLEEISKANTIGSQLRDYDNANHDGLRADVFEMVRHNAFKEYRDARFLKDFHDDPEKWSQLKSGEKHVASRLAMDVKTNASSTKAKIAAIETQVQRAIERKDVEFGEEDVEALQRTATRIYEHVHPGVRPFHVALKNASRALGEATLLDVKALSLETLAEFREALDYFDGLVSRHGKGA